MEGLFYFMVRTARLSRRRWRNDQDRHQDQRRYEESQMSEQVTKDELPTPFYNRADHAWELTPDQWRKVCDLFTDLRASLRREENARKVLADENERMRSELISLRASYANTSGIKP
jgi:hypothetical protein